MAQTQSRKQRILGDVKKARRRRAIVSTLLVVVIAVSIVAALILLTPKPPPPSNLIGQPISTVTNNQLTGVTYTTLQSVDSPQGVTPLTTVNGSPLKVNGKNEFLYIGAEYCPFCAAERWSIIVALSKFGNFSGLTYMQSSATDSYPNTATFSFYAATYQSQHNITFISVEIQDRNHNPLQTPTQPESALMSQYDPGGSIPFIDIGGTYLIQPSQNQPNVYAGSQYSPALLANLNWTQIGSQLNTSSSPVAQAIDGAANTIIKAICQLDGGNPGTVCGLTLAPPTQAPFGPSSVSSSTLDPIITTEADSGYTIGKTLD